MMQKSLVFSFLFLLAVVGCESDAYDKGEGEYSLMYADFADAYSDASRTLTAIETDEGESLALTAPYSASWIQIADTTYRVMLYYNKVETTKAEVLSLRRVAVIQPMAEDELEQYVKTDPLKLDAAWVSRNHRYLNLRLTLLTGTPDDPDATQTVGLVSQGTVTRPDGTTCLLLRLYHDQDAVPQYYSATTYASIKLQTIDADSLQLSVNTYDGEVTRTFTVR